MTIRLTTAGALVRWMTAQRTVLDGRTALRFSIGGRTTTETHVRAGWRLLRELAE